MNNSRRKLLGAAGAAAVAGSVPSLPAWANSPVKIGMSMPQTGPLGGGG